MLLSELFGIAVQQKDSNTSTSLKPSAPPVYRSKSTSATTSCELPDKSTRYVTANDAGARHDDELLDDDSDDELADELEGDELEDDDELDEDELDEDELDEDELGSDELDADELGSDELELEGSTQHPQSPGGPYHPIFIYSQGA